MSMKLKHTCTRWAESFCLACALIAEPVCHALGLPHPEGLAAMVANHIAVRR